MSGPSPARPAGPAAPEPAVLAAVVAAAAQLLAAAGAPAAAPEGPAPHLAWRFSGRWWARPTVARRDRPWAGRLP